MKPGDLILSREDTFFSKLIRFVTRCNWSHVSIYIGEDEFISAIPFQGICIKSMDIISDAAICEVIDITEEQRELVVDISKCFLGRAYDFWQAIMLGYKIITGNSSRYNDIYKDHFVCSEFVAEVYAQVGIHFGYFADNVLPSTIRKSGLVKQIEEIKRPPPQQIHESE